MGIYLGQLPPAEIARLKAELAETLIANFCYPRFFDARTQSLRMRPVDRAKRQEVWLFLSSVDFTQWSRIDLMSPEIQHQIERLFIQFVQRNRSFFGEQGRKRMSDVRMLIGSSASTVVVALRNHVTGQRQNNPPFGSPRPAVSWSAASTSGQAEPSWEQIAAATMLLQQQVQEARGEVKPAATAEGRAPILANGTGRRTIRPVLTGGAEQSASSATISSPAPASLPGLEPQVNMPAAQVAAAEMRSQVNTQAVQSPATGAGSQVNTPAATPAVGAKRTSPLGTSSSASAPISTGPVNKLTSPVAPPIDVPVKPAPVAKAVASGNVNARSVSTTEAVSASPSSTSLPGRSLAQSAPSASSSQRETAVAMGEDDVAIFEQLRHQLIVWLRVEAVTAGLEISGQSPSQLLELLRQQGRLDETRLQVVSTLLNLSNQVIKTGVVSILDYKQALLFHLMHTRR
ncbi:hypothetical protein EPA93_42830 [Ktedonosporobacter rubrisoli]|uniref:Uncharacterized protein n=1 Tax=Ktedonosporobacter rubrisoli TaxID=2509675 RepID=A0A4P6K2I5_KTERU|nr:hypothetical protein [Ktedonosporobacter rubrisoli]QBD82354.1 hypothetical protein EPA93_42830 [Ktedonosporobacter rubrisoli]